MLGIHSSTVVDPAKVIFDKVRQEVCANSKIMAPIQPEGSPPPTLASIVSDMDLHTAAHVHHTACRWLEFIDRHVALEEAVALTLRTTTQALERRTKFTYGQKVEKWAPEALKELETWERATVMAEATVIAIFGLRKSLDQVKIAASRAITRHTKEGGIPLTTGG